MTTKDKNPKRGLFITGGSRGIGRDIVMSAAHHGYEVAFTYRTDDDAAKAVERDVQGTGGKVIAIRADVASQDDIEAAIEQAHDFLGHIDAVVANAGIIGEPRAITEAAAAHLTEVFAVNVFGVFYTIGASVRRMSIRNGGLGGAIVVMSSVAARTGGMPREAHYAASKGAIDGMTLALAKELPAHGVRINALRPGMIRTDIHDVHGGEATLRATAPGIPLGRVGEASEITAAAMFLLSADASYVHGAILDAGGGR